MSSAGPPPRPPTHNRTGQEHRARMRAAVEQRSAWKPCVRSMRSRSVSSSTCSVSAAWMRSRARVLPSSSTSPVIPAGDDRLRRGCPSCFERTPNLTDGSRNEVGDRGRVRDEILVREPVVSSDRTVDPNVMGSSRPGSHAALRGSRTSTFRHLHHLEASQVDAASLGLMPHPCELKACEHAEEDRFCSVDIAVFDTRIIPVQKAFPLEVGLRVTTVDTTSCVGAFQVTGGARVAAGR